MAAPRPGYQRSGSSIAVSNKTIVLVTEGDKGVGAKIVQALATLRSDFQVLLGCTETHNGEMAVASMGAPINVNPIQLDLSSDQSIDHAEKAIEQHFGRIDILINNAEVTGSDGVAGTHGEAGMLSLRDVWRTVLDVNVTGTAALTASVLPLLEASNDPRIFFITNEMSTLASATESLDAKLLPLILSKAAVNRLVVQYAKMKPKIRVNACYLDQGKAAQDSAEAHQTGADVVAKLVTSADSGSGQLYSSTGVVPW